MTTTKNEIRVWLENRRPVHTHMLVVCDTFDHEDYPVYVRGSIEDYGDIEVICSACNTPSKISPEDVDFDPYGAMYFDDYFYKCTACGKIVNVAKEKMPLSWWQVFRKRLGMRD